ncbi:MAG: GxxExxY protein [Prosthecobacter sp.]|uniref:GxxExxY protein n=1 Tax=Prosthecobacter sp. TaxID=1965333 RepID=UPI0038FE2C6A
MSKDPFSHLIIGKAMQTHSALGPGLVEEFYHQHLVGLLRADGIEHLSKPRFDLIYRGYLADTFEPDLVFPGKLIPELKALRGELAPSHFTQLFAYLKSWQIPVGLLMDFGKASLAPVRVRFDPVEADFPTVPIPPRLPHQELARHLIEILNRMHADIGLGYRETTWQGIFVAALQAESLSFLLSPEVAILNQCSAALRCILVENVCPVSITALGDGISTADRAVLQSNLRRLGLPWGIAAHFGRRCVDVRIIQVPANRHL